VIDLTEDMLQKPSQPSFSEPNEMDDSQLDDIDDVELTRSDIVAEDIVAETPELTTTETNVLADATAAIKEINEEEKANAEIPMAPIPSQESSSPPAPAQATSSSNILPTFMGILGMAVGGFGAWMAYDASNQVADMERQLQSIDAASQAGADPEMIDIQQRLTKIERRLTGTPTLEAAAPLGTPTSDMAVAPGTAAKPLQVITPKTKVKAATASTTVQKELAAVAATTNAPSKGGWVVNVSSHRKESLATKEMRRLQKIGLNAELHQTQIKNSTWYRVQVTGFATKDEAKAALRDIEQRSGIKGIWISVKK
jgi:cell division protein FtsN